jgi:quinolinate synthase
MAMNGLRNLRDAIENGSNEIYVDPEIGRLAQRSITRMLDFAKGLNLAVATTEKTAWNKGVGPA